MYQFEPKRLYIEEGALEYPAGRYIKDEFEKKGASIKIIETHQRVTGIPGETREQGYKEAKKTLVVGIRKSKDFQTCKPSADYQLPFATSCPGLCQYCYLNTTLGKKPYMRVYVNKDDILGRAKKYIDENVPDTTVFEGAATSDPLPVEDLTGNLKESINFFAGEDYGEFRFVTKFSNVESLLDLDHREKTQIRFSLNTDSIIKNYELGTPNLDERVKASAKVFAAGYPIGFLIAPVMKYPGYKEEYSELFKELKEQLGRDTAKNLPFEIITHRFTKRAKENINQIFPDNELPMDEDERRFKYGQFGYGKYVYTKEDMEELETFIEKELKVHFPQGELSYFV